MYRKKEIDFRPGSVYIAQRGDQMSNLIKLTIMYLVWTVCEPHVGHGYVWTPVTWPLTQCCPFPWPYLFAWRRQVSVWSTVDFSSMRSTWDHFYSEYQIIILYNGILNYTINITVIFHTGQRVKSSSVAPIPDTWETDFHCAWWVNSARKGDRLIQTPQRINTDKLKATQSQLLVICKQAME